MKKEPFRTSLYAAIEKNSDVFFSNNNDDGAFCFDFDTNIASAYSNYDDHHNDDDNVDNLVRNRHISYMAIVYNLPQYFLLSIETEFNSCIYTLGTTVHFEKLNDLNEDDCTCT